ncbi:rhodanese-like domain-containing protein [soil metagenome]
MDLLKYLADSWMLVLTAVVSGLALLLPALLKQRQGATSVSSAEATRLINTRNASVVDVRSSEEFAGGHIVGSRNIPSEQLPKRLAELGKNRSNPVIVADGNGRGAAALCAMLRKEGFAEAVALQGGVAAWRDAGMPLRKAA